MKFEDVDIIRSKRKTISIEIQEDGHVFIRAPFRASAHVLQEFFREKHDWIERGVKKQKRLFAKRPKRCFEHGENFLYLGNPMELNIRSKRGIRGRPLEVSDALYLCPSAKHQARSVIERWYRSRARFVFQERAEFYAPHMQVMFGTIRLSSANTRWGSCGSKNSLNFNWRLIMAPVEVIDSVIVHELAHCKYKNHGQRFWQFVHTHCSQYPTHDKWLKTHAHSLHWD